MLGEPSPIWREWPHAPPHLFVPNAVYFVTASTHGRQRIFSTPNRLSLMQATCFDQAGRFGWRLEAWAFMANHYHLVARAPDDASTLVSMLRAFHSLTARAVNAADSASGRKVWFQYRDTCIDNPRSYMARLHYVHSNPVKHRLVEVAENYPWCSMGWFMREAQAGFRETVLAFPFDRVAAEDDFD